MHNALQRASFTGELRKNTKLETSCDKKRESRYNDMRGENANIFSFIIRSETFSKKRVKR